MNILQYGHSLIKDNARVQNIRRLVYFWKYVVRSGRHPQPSIIVTISLCVPSLVLLSCVILEPKHNVRKQLGIWSDAVFVLSLE